VIGRWRDRVPLRLRIFFRGAFLLLAVATVALALSVLREEKQLSYRGYRDVFRRNVEQITARLQHPTGQLALLNPAAGGGAVTPLRPLVLPFSGIDFDDRAKAQQAVEMAGCLVQYPDDAQLCVSIGNSPSAGGFIYAVGAFVSGPLVEHVMGDRDLSLAHRLQVEVALRGRTYRWLAPLETTAVRRSAAIHGRLTGFAEDEQGRLARRPDKEFRGWLWQDARCMGEGAAVGGSAGPCQRRSFYSVRLPVDVFREDLYANDSVVWPPRDLADVHVRVVALAPGDTGVLFDSDRAGATAPFSLSDLRGQLLVGETLRIRKLVPGGAHDVALLTAADDGATGPSPFLSGIIRHLPVEGYDQPLEATRTVATPLGAYEVRLTGDVRGVDRSLGVVAGRLYWYVGAMLAAILATWLAIEARIIRRITLLTTRAAAVKKSVHGPEGLVQHDLADLRGRDELGLLAGVLADLLQRVNEDVKREQIRTRQEKDMWHAVGHEIMSPLQSLLALHAEPQDPGLRYIQRMQQAVRVLYGGASPSEAILSATLQVSTLDLRSFLRHVADNAADAGIEGVEFDGAGEPLVVKAEEHSLEDVITHVLTNAARYRPAGTPIRLALGRSGTVATVRIHNAGPPIDEGLLGRIFEYGVSDAADGGAPGSRGQGLFVARTYMAKMGGTIEAHNAADGVEFVLTLVIT
jgi:signal transduction histidine kinase